MESSRIRTWSEAVGLIAVVASLVFVGLEVRQNADATRAATAQSLNDGWLQWNLAMADPAAWSAVRRVSELDDPAEAPYEERAAVDSLMRSLFQHWSNLYWQYLRGDLSPELWDGALRDMGNSINGTPEEDWPRLVSWAWERNRHIYFEEFQTLFEQTLATRSRGKRPPGT